MTTSLFRKFARLACLAGLACAGILLLADTSPAATRTLKGTYGQSQVFADCKAANGVPTSGTGAGGYGCIATGGTVNCTAKGKCTGTCTKCAALAKGLNGVLHPPASAGTASTRGGVTNNKPPLHNVNQPVVVQHSGGGHSGGSKH